MILEHPHKETFKRRKRARACLPLFVVAAALCLPSCGDAISGRAAMLKGAAAWHNQDWDEAIFSFLPAASSSNKAVSDYADYGLALTYIEQNELKAAMLRLSAIEGAASDELRAAVWYEKGVCEYLGGNYSEAAECFRRSLEIEGSRADAKINLELSLMRSESENANAASFSPLQAAASESEGRASEDAVFSLIERKEVEQWKKLSHPVKESPVPDY